MSRTRRCILFSVSGCVHGHGKKHLVLDLELYFGGRCLGYTTINIVTAIKYHFSYLHLNYNTCTKLSLSIFNLNTA